MGIPSRIAQRRRNRGRGQGLVEFALVAPVLLLVLLMAVDFGRALYGWVVLQNSTRIAANYAGLHPDGWQPPGNPAIVAEYRAELTADLSDANCAAQNPPPDPVFTDGPDTAHPDGPPDTAYDLGDSATVVLSCNFSLLTPIIGGILGNPIQLTASSEFRIRTGHVVGLANPTQIPPPPGPPTPTPAPTAAPSATPPPPTPPPCIVSVSISRSPNGVIRNGTQVTFTGSYSATNCSIVSYAWTFPNGTPGTANTAGPHNVLFNVSSNTSVDVLLTVTTNTGATASDTERVNLRP